MRKTIGVSMSALILLFGGAGVANATELSGPAPTTTTVVAQEADDDGGDKTGLWGLAGLLGLAGLAGLLKRRRDDYPAAGGGAGLPPRA
jgi:MYXO-CTERM domain-containing protein